jgi:Tfp pilus assembly protein PilV
LVVTISMMVLLTLLAVGLLSLATVQVRGSGQGEAQALARANARMALELAIAELQRHAGPDQRVTAPAEMTGSKSHPRWVGVYRTTTTAGGYLPVVQWSSRDSALTDARSSGSLGAAALRETWLVSGEPTGEPDAASGEMITLVGDGTVEKQNDRVQVPFVPVSAANGSAGGFAYWCSDESFKASLNLPQQDPNPIANEAMPPERFGAAALAGMDGYEGVDDATLEKLTGYGQVALSGAGSRESLAEHFHSLGHRASAVLADPVRSGLKRDLSVFFEDGQVPAKGPGLDALAENTPILSGDRRRGQGPKFGALRSYAQVESGSSGGGVAVRAAARTESGDKFGAVPDLESFNTQPIHPVIVSAEFYTRFAYVRGYLTVHLFPRVVLWNPYNAALQSQAYTVDFNICLNDSMTIEKRTASGTEDIGNRAFDTRGAKQNRLSLTLEATAFEPGEALVFSPRVSTGALAGRAAPLATRNGSGENLLSAKVNPADLTNFYLTLGDPLPGVTARDLPVYANHNRGAYYWVDMMDWWERNPDNGLKVSLHLGRAGNYSDRLKLPLLQLLDSDNWRRGYEGGYNNGRWRVGGVEPVYDYERTADFEPWARGAYGIRFKWWVERNPYNYAGTGGQRFWSSSPISDHNLRAVMAHRSPYDAVTDTGESHHWYMWGPYTTDREQGLPFISSERLGQSGGNGYRVSPFYGNASSRPGSTWPVYDLPAAGEKIISLGRLQHVQLSPFIWHSGFPIGNSWVPANQIRREQSADAIRTVDAAWTGYVPFLPDWMKQGRATPGRGDIVIYDLSYEVNHELWDRYFLSGAIRSEKDAFATDPAASPLPNPKLVPVAGKGVDATALGGFYEAAGEVLMAGAFNVNTTDVDAWRAFLASMSRGEGGETAFSRFHTSQGEVDADNPYQPSSWTGTRVLSESEITALAEAIVEQVKLRGPFLSVSDFVNRRLVRDRGTNSNNGLMGPLQQAIEDSGLNDGLQSGDVAMSTTGYGQASYEPGSNAEEWAPTTHLRKSKATGMPAYLQQGDILQPLGGMLVARGDTFVVRAYGDARSPDGTRVLARAWCEAEVQRLPSYVDPSDKPEEPVAISGTVNNQVSALNRRFGRKFLVVSFRWLSPNEI